MRPRRQSIADWWWRVTEGESNWLELAAVTVLLLGVGFFVHFCLSLL